MEYIKVEFEDGRVGYQVVTNDEVVSYVDESGAPLFQIPEVGLGSKVIDATPARQDWMQ